MQKAPESLKIPPEMLENPLMYIKIMIKPQKGLYRIYLLWEKSLNKKDSILYLLVIPSYI